MDNNDKSWLELRKYILKELERLDKEVSLLDTDVRANGINITNLRLKVAGIAVGVSLVTSAVTGVVTSLIVWLLTR